MWVSTADVLTKGTAKNPSLLTLISGYLLDSMIEVRDAPGELHYARVY